MSLSQLEQWLGAHAQSDLPPVESWHPEHCGDINIVVRRDGSWWHDGHVIQRQSLIRLFSRILRLDGDDYVLVTPGEKMRIQVEDTPFFAVLGDVHNGYLTVMTSTGDEVIVGPEHPITLKKLDDELLPVVEIRRGLTARVCRNLYYQWVELAQENEHGHFILNSGKNTYRIG